MTTHFHRLLSIASTAALTYLATPATAESVTRSANCYFFRNELLEIIETCQLQTHGLWGTGPVTHQLFWPDGVITDLEFSQDCGDNFKVDGVCGSDSYRSYDTLDRLSLAERDRLIQDGLPYLPCSDVGENSVCWEPLEDI